ncbi:hypothetical protein JRO89_XS15G0177500 [Xanthoceras sorbifolium]|uniref:Uncharacterized protein n=1 Tax=Xanthoceras sorbifolium TaxID=99658 RepID=A0ABQ8H2S4_9ROSI|nr:hypothetical protein JRO89_XS15G0177500 [Xanthoceras sorbifolium]
MYGRITIPSLPMLPLVSCLLDDNDYDLYTTALLFRVLRQHGYKVSSSTFNKFKDNKGKFKENLTSDAKGMLSLYEATHLRHHGEDILEEALVFSKDQLKSLVEKSSPHLTKQIINALETPLHKGMSRLEALKYISFYQEDESRNETLLLFASWILIVYNYCTNKSYATFQGLFSYTAAEFLGMEKEIAGIDTFEWLQTRPKILTAAYQIVRLKNDLIGHKV